MTDINNIPQNTQEVIKKGHEIYENKKNEFEPANNGKYVAIEVNSGDSFVGETREESVAAARIRYPRTILYVRRIGAIEKVARHSPYYLSGHNNARIF